MGCATLRYTDADGQHAVVLDRTITSLGRSTDRDVVVADPCVSRLHATIVREGGGYTFVDEKSTHGSYVNARRVQRAALHPNDVLQLGSLEGLRLQLDLEEVPVVDPEPEPELERPAEVGATALLTSLQELRRPVQGPSNAAREMEQLNWLLRAARQLNEGGAVEEILGALLQVTLQLTGVDRGFVFLREDAGMRLALGLNAKGERLGEDSTISRQAMQRAIEGDLKYFVSDTLADTRAGEWVSVLANRIRSIYCIPLRKRGSGRLVSELLGLLYLDSLVSPVGMSEIDHQLLETIANEAAALLHNALMAEEEAKARQAREELAVAAAIHSGLMSKTLPVMPFARLEAKSVPCLAIGGDFYDAVALPDRVCVAVADVSGKGVSAAIVAATLQGIVHSQFLAGQGLAAIASLANQFLCTRNVGKYATMVMLQLWADGRMEWINCGHIQPLAIHDGQALRLDEGNLVVGLIPGAAYVCSEYRMRPGERMLIATDGVTEAEDAAGECFGHEGVAQTGCGQGGGVGEILDAVARFHAPALAQDDCTLLEIVYTGAGAA